MNQTIKWRRTKPGNKGPQKAYASDAGIDLSSDCQHVIKSGEWCKVELGVSMLAPCGFFYLLLPRSSMFFKHGLLASPPGVIDAGYTGPLCIYFFNTGSADVVLDSGTRVAQAVLLEVPRAELIEVSSYPDTERGPNGFGSSGK